MYRVDYILVAVCAISVFINLALVGLCLKLYTEYFKDRRIRG